MEIAASTSQLSSFVTLDQVLDDLQSRFIINIPEEELESIERICFQIEQAHWFYEDFVRETNAYLPSFSLKRFSALFFKHCPLLHSWANDHEAAFATFMEYKVRVPVCGAIILNEAMDKVLLVQGWKSNSAWSFPRGKINKEERRVNCAVREVLEETGFDISPYLKDSDYIERTIREQQITMFIVKGIPENSYFETQTRKEIGDIKWFDIEKLPLGTKKESSGANTSKAKFYMVTAFLGDLKKWILRQKSSAKKSSASPSKKKIKTISEDVGSTGRQFLKPKHAVLPASNTTTSAAYNTADESDGGYPSDSGHRSDYEYRFTQPGEAINQVSAAAIQKASLSLKQLLGIPTAPPLPTSSSSQQVLPNSNQVVPAVAAFPSSLYHPPSPQSLNSLLHNSNHHQQQHHHQYGPPIFAPRDPNPPSVISHKDNLLSILSTGLGANQQQQQLPPSSNLPFSPFSLPPPPPPTGIPSKMFEQGAPHIHQHQVLDKKQGLLNILKGGGSAPSSTITSLPNTSVADFRPNLLPPLLSKDFLPPSSSSDEDALKRMLGIKPMSSSLSSNTPPVSIASPPPPSTSPILANQTSASISTTASRSSCVTSRQSSKPALALNTTPTISPKTQHRSSPSMSSSNSMAAAGKDKLYMGGSNNKSIRPSSSRELLDQLLSVGTDLMNDEDNNIGIGYNAGPKSAAVYSSSSIASAVSSPKEPRRASASARMRISAGASSPSNGGCVDGVKIITILKRQTNSNIGNAGSSPLNPPSQSGSPQKSTLLNFSFNVDKIMECFD